MFYQMYLSSLCHRRAWNEPQYEAHSSRHGHFCTARVNNREYCTDVPYETVQLAKEGVAMKAWMITRNFSANDGRFPGQRPGQKSASGVAQGLPVAIGTGRRGDRSSSVGSDGTTSGGSSPTSGGDDFEPHVLETSQRPLQAARRRTDKPDQYLCRCGRGTVRAHGFCEWCQRERHFA